MPSVMPYSKLSELCTLLRRTLKWMLILFPLRQGPREGRKSLARQECLECPCGFTCLGFVQPQFSS